MLGGDVIVLEGCYHRTETALENAENLSDFTTLSSSAYQTSNPHLQAILSFSITNAHSLLLLLYC